jgi:hypothetical protein
MNTYFRLSFRSPIFGAIAIMTIATITTYCETRGFAQQAQRSAEKRFTMQFDKTPWN